MGLVTNQEYRETKETFDQTCADALHCKELQNIEQGNTLEQRVDEVIRGWEQKTKPCKHHIFDDHEQTIWTNHEGKDSPMSHGHDINYNCTTPRNEGVNALQANPGNDDDSTLTPKGSNSISEDSHASSLYSCWCVGWKATYHDTALKLLIEADTNWIHIYCTST